MRFSNERTLLDLVKFREGQSPHLAHALYKIICETYNARAIASVVAVIKPAFTKHVLPKLMNPVGATAPLLAL